MIKVQRLQELLDIFSIHRYPIALKDLLAQVDYSEATLKRYIRRLRESGTPIDYIPSAKGYVLKKSNDAGLQLPGCWFTIPELHALLAINELIQQLRPGILKTELVPFRKRITNLLASRGVAPKELTHRIQFIGMGIRECCPAIFRTVVTALIGQTRLRLCYHSRTQNQECAREVSPQKLLYYQNNWYLAVFCHVRNALRTLSLERMSQVTLLETPCRKVDEHHLQEHFFSSFGIFAGQPIAEAVLRFSPTISRWVADARWHPDQQGHFLADGSYELHLPYSDQRELVMEILRYGPDVKVIAPKSLQQELCNRLRQALNVYANQTHEKK